MKNRKVARLIALLTPREKRNLLPWLQLELPPKQDKARLLVEHILNKDPIEDIWHSFFPKKKSPQDIFADPGFRRIETELTRYIERYLAWLSFRKDQNSMDLYLIKSLNQRNAKRLFIIQWNKIRKKIESRHDRGSTYYYLLYELEKLFYFFQIKHVDLKIDRPRKDYFQYFDSWWIHEKLRLNLVNTNDRLRGKSNSQLRLVEEAFQLLDSDEDFQDMPVLKIYWLTYRMLSYEEESYELVNELWLHSDWLGHNEFKDIYMAILNFYTRSFFQEKATYYQSQLDFLYDWGLDKKLLIRDGVFSWATYRNIVVIWLGMGLAEKARSFIEEYYMSLPLAEREETYAYCQALYFFDQKDYSKSIRLLNQRYHQASIEVSARILRIKARYERGERIEIESELNALQTFLSRHKELSAMIQQKLKDDIIILRKLIEVVNKKQKEDLVEEIKKVPSLTNRNWYLEKLGKADSNKKL
ncbi:MAG: hypothetical protein AB8H47_08150 [Bacteroidia bacterium]